MSTVEMIFWFFGCFEKYQVPGRKILFADIQIPGIGFSNNSDKPIHGTELFYLHRINNTNCLSEIPEIIISDGIKVFSKFFFHFVNLLIGWVNQNGAIKVY